MNKHILTPDGGRFPASVVLVTTVATLLFGLCTLAWAQSSYVALIEGESMSESDPDVAVANDSKVSARKYLKYTGLGSASKAFSTTAAGEDVILKLRGVRDSSVSTTNQWGKIKVTLDEVNIWEGPVNWSTWQELDTNSGMLAIGSHTLTVEATEAMGANQEVHLDLARVPAAGAAAPPPNGERPCDGVQVAPTQDLSAVAAKNPAGTTFCLEPGTYTVTQNIPVQSGDKFIGLSTDRSQVKVTTNATSKTYAAPENGGNGSQNPGSTVQHVFYTHGADNVTIDGLDISGAVHDNACEPNCGRGIGGGGKNLTVRNVILHHNEHQGIGGAGDGLLVENIDCYNNGNNESARDPRLADPGRVGAACVKSVSSMKVFDSRIHDNFWVGVWCDIECGAFEVHDSVIERNGKAAIHDEISSGPAVFEGNTIRNNGLWPLANQHTGLLIVSSANVDAYGNTFGGNVSEGIKIMEDARTPDITNVKVHDNTMNGDKLVGCSVSGATCTNNS